MNWPESVPSALEPAIIDADIAAIRGQWILLAADDLNSEYADDRCANGRARRQEWRMGVIDYRSTKELPIVDIVNLYKSNGWSSAQKPEILLKALKNSENVISAWSEDRLIGLGNAISDGCLLVYYPHLLVLPDYHGRGVGREIIRQLKEIYKDFHQHIIVSEFNAVNFYQSVGFSRAGNTVLMWIYEGNDH